MPKAHPAEVDRAFAGNHELRKRVHDAIDENPSSGSLFRDISVYILGLSSQPSTEPNSKKRKIEGSNGATDANAGGLGNLASAAVKAWKTYPPVSFSLPQRKKLTLELVAGKEGGIRGVTNESVEFSIAWKDVEQIFCLPVPDKAKRQHNFVVFPTHGDGVNPVPDYLAFSPPEPILWTFDEPKKTAEDQETGPEPMANAINQCMAEAGVRKDVVFPDADEFASAIAQSHRKGEKAYHVKAHRGSKEGYLFFTAVGILSGFKKPLAFFDFGTIFSISYTNVLRNTFNLVIATEGQETEFSMIDQLDFNGINEYVQKHGLQDASLAAERKAKKLNVNAPKKGQNGTNGAPAEEPEDGETELQKAERELEDEEDEDEEDYDPGSEGESEGSGTDDSDDEEGDGDGDAEEYDEDDGEGAPEDMDEDGFEEPEVGMVED